MQINEAQEAIQGGTEGAKDALQDAADKGRRCCQEGHWTGLDCQARTYWQAMQIHSCNVECTVLSGCSIFTEKPGEETGDISMKRLNLH